MDNILVIEDAPNFLRWVAAAISRHFPGCEVRTAATAHEAETKLAADTPVAVVLDLALPRDRATDPPSPDVGMSLLQRLTGGAHPVPTVVMSSHDAEAQCQAAGALAFVSKSSPSALRELVNALRLAAGGLSKGDG